MKRTPKKLDSNYHECPLLEIELILIVSLASIVLMQLLLQMAGW